MRYHVATLSLLIILAPISAAPPATADRKEKAPAVSKRIDQLVNVAAGDIGYSVAINGTAFAPVDQHQAAAVLLFQKPSARSKVLRDLIAMGVDAVPALLAHLDDKRPTKLKFKSPGIMWLSEGVDTNARTDKPLKLSTKLVPKTGKLAGLMDSTINSYTVTVGDLCFVAIGQIVNRRYNALRYIPSGMAAVTSASHSSAIREQVRRRWSGLTRARHRASLMADFLKPDGTGRRAGAIVRLSYYYPAALDPVMVRLLARPTYDPNLIETFVRDKLYHEHNPKQCRKLLDEYVHIHGEAARTGILLQLFADLQTLEEHEEQRMWPDLKLGQQPRTLLIQLFGNPKNVRSKDRPTDTEALSALDVAEIIRALISNHSKRIDRAVRDVLSHCENDVLGFACMDHLAGRGYGNAIRTYCLRRLRQVTDPREKHDFHQELEKLGWTALHAAASRGDVPQVAGLLNKPGLLNAPAANGQTPLSVAAAQGELEVVKLLVARGASVDAKDRAGMTVVQRAARHDHEEVVRFLVSHGCAIPDVLVAILADHLDRVDSLLKADPNATRVAMVETGKPPLHLAAASGNVKLAEKLVAHGALVDAGKERAATPLTSAAIWDKAEMVSFLVKHGADIEVGAPDDDRPLHLAVACNSIHAAERLLAAKADVNARDGVGDTPLYIAVEKRNAKMVRLLLDHKADPTLKSRATGQSPRDFAADGFATAEICKLLGVKPPKR